MPISLKYVHIYEICIWRTMDKNDVFEDGDQGEFVLHFGANQTNVTRPRVRGSTWILPVGCHKIDEFIGPIFLTPELDLDDYLVLFFEVLEQDTFGDDFRAYFTFIHPPDMTNPDSWKRNHHHDFSITDNDGVVTVHWYFVLNE